MVSLTICMWRKNIKNIRGDMVWPGWINIMKNYSINILISEDGGEDDSVNVSIAMISFGHVWFSIAWFGQVWFGQVWFGWVWFGQVWFGQVQFGQVKPSVFGLVWFVWFILGRPSYNWGILKGIKVQQCIGKYR